MTKDYCPQHGYPVPCYKCGYPESLELDELKRIIRTAENCIVSMKKQIGALKQENEGLRKQNPWDRFFN